MLNTLGSVDVPLELFGGLNTEIQPADLPEGVSPDNQDVEYLPGSVNSRAALHKIFATAFANSPTVVYGKTYTQPNENPLNLYLDSNGIFYQEDVVNSPGTTTQIGTTIPGSMCNSVSAFGREYIAVNDGLHGLDVPRQYDGTHIDRVTQDGPGAPPAVTDVTASFNLLGSPNGIIYTTSFATITNASENGNVVVFVLSAPFAGFPLQVGDPITVVNYTGAAAGYNAAYAISAISQDQLTVQAVSTVTSLPVTSATGQMDVGTVAFITTAPPNIVVGQNFVVAAAGVPGYNGTYQARAIFPAFNEVEAIIPVGALGNSGGGTLTGSGQISQGVHQCVYGFITRQGALTKPSPTFFWAAAGGKKALVANLAIGPSNVVARYIAFTGAGGANFFSILASSTLPNPGGAPIITTSTIVPDNTSTSAIVDFSDNTLFDANAIDIPGNNLFAQVVLGPVLNFFSYAGRLGAYGEYNKVQNLLNMGFDGGFNQILGTALPTGWSTSGSTGGTPGMNPGLAGVPGFSYVMFSNGGTNDCMLSQPAYEDLNGIPIIQPLTQYQIRILAQRTFHTIPINGSLTFELFSPTAGSLAIAPFLAGGIPQTSPGWQSVTFFAQTPATIPTDTVLRFYLNGVNTGLAITVDELMLIPTVTPYTDTTAKVSYFLNPEGFDGVTGILGSAEDPNPLRTFPQIRDNLYFHTSERLHQTSDNGTGEPSTWTVREVSNKVGALSARASTTGEEWFITASRGGPYVFAGGDLYKAGQEIQSLWDSINFTAQSVIWAENDSIKRRVYFGVPTGAFVTPSLILPLDYRELNTAYDVASNGPVHISYSGKMISSDLTRKWTRWNVFANFGRIMKRPANVAQFTVGAGNGQGLGAASGFGNVYFFDPLKFTDDDYGQIVPYYTTYAFLNHEAEVALGTGCHRKLYAYQTIFVTGIGNLTITPLVDTLANAMIPSPLFALSQNPTFDLENALNVLGERSFFKLQPFPLPGTTDVNFSLKKMVTSIRQDPWMPIRGSVF